MKKETEIQLVIIVILIIILGILVAITINEMAKNNQTPIGGRDDTRQDFSHPSEEKTEKETKASDIEAGQEVLDNNIDLSQYNSNISITKSGEYTILERVI